MLFEGQDSVKKELIKRYPLKDFSWINDILPKEEEEEEQVEERQNSNHSFDSTLTEDVIIVENVIGAQEGVSEEDPPAL